MKIKNSKIWIALYLSLLCYMPLCKSNFNQAPYVDVSGSTSSVCINNNQVNLSFTFNSGTLSCSSTFTLVSVELQDPLIQVVTVNVFSNYAVYPTKSGDYKVVGFTLKCGSALLPAFKKNNGKSFYVDVNPIPAAITGPNQTILSGNSTIIGTSAVSGNTYSWTSNPAGFTSSISNPTITPTVNTTYTLTETLPASSGGCSNTKSVLITVIGDPSSGDCLAAIPVCGETYVRENPPGNPGSISDFSQIGSCSGSSEYNGNWYKITIVNDGFLKFNIIPFDYHDNYDFAIFNVGCGQTNTTPPISYNLCSTPGITGLRDGSSQTQVCCTSVSDQYNQPRQVHKGEVYYLYIGSPASPHANSGYTIDFRNSGPVIVDNTALSLSSASIATSCAASPGFTLVTVHFSRPVIKTSVVASEFTVTDANGYPYTVNTVTPASSTGNYETEFSLVFQYSGTPPFPNNINGGAAAPDNLYLALSGFIRDACGNVILPQKVKMNVSYSDQITISAAIADNCLMNKTLLIANISPAPTTYYWYKDGKLIPGQNGSQITITDPGSYSVSGIVSQCLHLSKPIIIN
jgi:hypothetical protein